MRTACFSAGHPLLVCGGPGIDLAQEDKERRKSWERNARKRALERFPLEKEAEQTLAIYEEVVTRRS